MKSSPQEARHGGKSRQFVKFVFYLYHLSGMNFLKKLKLIEMIQSLSSNSYSCSKVFVMGPPHKDAEVPPQCLPTRPHSADGHIKMRSHGGGLTPGDHILTRHTDMCMGRRQENWNGGGVPKSRSRGGGREAWPRPIPRTFRGRKAQRHPTSDPGAPVP